MQILINAIKIMPKTLKIVVALLTITAISIVGSFYWGSKDIRLSLTLYTLFLILLVILTFKSRKND